MMENQFQILPGIHPITPVILGDARLASAFAEQMLKLGIYVVGFSYPVVPVGQARIRTQISAIHSESDLDAAVHAFVETRRILQLPTMSTEKS
jgi:glycine C-acetyltransferase